MQYLTTRNYHQCKLGIDVIKSCFAPLHPERFWIDVVLRRLKQIIILDLNDRKCKNFFSSNKSMRLEFKRHLRSPHRYIIHPFSKANALMEMVFLVLILFRYSLLGIKYGEAFIRMDMLANALWAFYMLSIFFTGYVKYDTKEICIHPRAIALHYLKTYFIFDLILFLKTPLRLCISSPTFHVYLVLATIFSFFVRFKSILFSLDNNLLYFGANKMVAFLIYEILKLTIFLHLIICAFIILPVYIHPENPYEWINELEKFPSRFEIYSTCFLIVVSYFFGVDYNLDTVDPLQNLVLFLLSFVGRLYTLDLIARVLGVFGITNISDSKYEQHLTVLGTYLSRFQLPNELKQRIMESFQKQSSKQHFDEGEIKSHLTDHLKTELFLYGARMLISKHSVLRKIPRSDLLALLAIMESKTFFSKDVITLSGDKFEYAYFISSGAVAGYDVYGQEIMHLEEGDEFGISWLAFKYLHSSLTWIALETTEVYFVKREDLVRYFDSQPEVAGYFEAKVREKFGKFFNSKEEWKTDREDVLVSLRKGNLLEMQKLRLFAAD